MEKIICECGIANSTESKFCSNCGKEIVKPLADNTETFYTLTIHYAHTLLPITKPKINIHLNGESRYTLISDYETLEFRLPAGKNNIMFKYAFMKNSFNIVMTKDTAISIKYKFFNRKIDLVTNAEVETVIQQSEEAEHPPKIHVASLVLSIIGLVFSIMIPMLIVCSIFGIGMAIKNRTTHKTMAALVIGIVGLVVTISIWVSLILLSQ